MSAPGPAASPPEPRRLRIIALAPNAWHGPWLNRQQLLSRIGQRHDVVYSTGATNRDTGPRPKYWPEAIRQDGVIVDVLPGWMAGALRRPVVRQATMRTLARRWRRLIRRPGSSTLVAWCFHPKYWPYLSYIKPDRLIYHAYDLYHLQGRWTAERVKAERELATRADLVVASSEPIARYLRDQGAANPLVVENAADYLAFAIDPDPARQPADLTAVPHPRIGYVGALNRKVDFPLLAWLAVRRPLWHFVLVGAIGNLDDETEAAVRQLQPLPNAHFLGFKPHSALPPYVSNMDVNLLAYRLSGDMWSEGIYPLKLHEYLAAGRPVVGADLPSVRAFHEVVEIARTREEWESAIAAALRDGGVERVEARRLVARRNDWDARVDTLERRLADLA